MAETVRELAVKLQLAVDKGSFGAGEAAIAKVKGQAQGLGSAFVSLKGALVGLGLVAAAHKAKEAFVDFNSTVEQSTISLAAMQRMYKQDSTWSESMRTATGLYGYYQEVAKASVGTTQDFIEMHRGIAASAYQAGGNLEDLKEITKGAVVASMSMGESAYTSAMDIKQALTKGVEVRDRFMNNLLASEKISKEKFNAMNKAERVATLKRLFQADWIKDASKQMEGSFAGLMSTLKDELSIAFGKVGKNFFEEQIASLRTVTKWIQNNQEEWKRFQGLAETGLTALVNLGKGLGAVLSIAVKPAMALLEGLQAIQDEGRYKAKELSVKGMREAYAQGPEAFNRYMARKYYKTEVDPDMPRMGGAGQSASKLAKEIADNYENMDPVEKAGYEIGNWLSGKKSLLTPERRRRQDAWVKKYRDTYGRAPSDEELNSFRADEDQMWRQGKITATGQGGYSAGPVMSQPDANYSSGYGPSRYMPLPVPSVAAETPSIPAGPAWSTAPETNVSGEVKINVRVEAVADTKVVSEDHSTELRASGALYSSESY